MNAHVDYVRRIDRIIYYFFIRVLDLESMYSNVINFSSVTGFTPTTINKHVHVLKHMYMVTRAWSGKNFS